tara:strand:+ start:2833 stop:3780 length:948 start_codon:yes stop_codon:yes gene_type:complete
MSVILITGGSGFLGRALAKKLKSNNDVILGSRNNTLNSYASIETGCKTFPLDVSNYHSIKDCINKYNPEIIIHAAATKFVDLSENLPLECIDINVQGSANLARACIESKVKTVIGISTDKTAPPIGNIYGLSKALMERLFILLDGTNNTKFSCVRFGNIAWSTNSVFPIWKKMMEKNNIIHSTGPHMRRFFFTIDDATNLVITAMKKINKTKGKILTLKMKSAQISKILDIWCEKYNTKWKKIKERPGDKIDEFLIGENELKNTYQIKFSNKEYYIIDYKKNYKNNFSSPISTENAEKLNKSEILKLINFDNEIK